MRNKKGIAPIFVLGLILIGVALIFGSNYILTADIFSTELFAKPSWARLECSPEDYYTTFLNKLDTKKVFKCESFTEECEFTIKNTKTSSVDLELGSMTPIYYLCDIYGKNCGGKQSVTLNKGETKTLSKIPSGKSYVFSFALGFSYNEKYTQISQSFKSWKLYRIVGGAKYVVNSFNCDLKSGDLSKVRQEDAVNRLFRQGGEGSKWVNYVNDWNYGPATNIVTYNGQNAYCSGAKVYSIVKLTMGDSSLVQINPTYKGTTSSGDVINGLGNLIANVECCPNEPNCGNDFKYAKPEETLKECFSDIQCYNAGGPVPQTGFTYVNYNCINNKCKQSAPITVECTSNAYCAGGEICDLSTLNYGKCIKQIARYCGDGLCDEAGGESGINCPDDCALKCKEGEYLVTEYPKGGALCFFGYGFCNDLGKIQYCKPGSNWYLWIIIILGTLVFIFLWKPIFRPLLKSIPGVGRIIP